MNGYEPVERDEVIQSVVSTRMWLEDSFGLSHVWYTRDLGCPFVLYTAFGRDWDLMSQMCIYILSFIYICDDMNICYLLLIIWCALVLFLVGNYPLSVVAHSIYSFFPQVWMLLVACRLYCNVQVIQNAYMLFRLSNVNCTVLFICEHECKLKQKSYVLHTFESLCKAMWANHLLGRCVVIKLIKSLYSFFYDWLCTPDVVTRWAVYSGMWPLSYLYIFPLCFVSIGLICKACSLELVHFTGKTLSVSFQKFCSFDGPDLLRVVVITGGIRAKVLRP